MDLNIVFDVGNVLIRWRPELAVAHVFPEAAEAMAYLERVGFFDWNHAQDGGRSFADGLAALEVAHPGQSGPLAAYLERFHLTIAEPIAGSWAALEGLRARGHRLFAITNFAAETWPIGLGVHPRLGAVFEDVVVSGHEGLLKPGAAIYQVLLARNGLAAGDCLFIDDSLPNVEGARAVGMQAHHFQGEDGLWADLRRRGLVDGLVD